MKSIFSMIKNIYISLLLIVTAIFIGCSDDDGEKIPYKGATTQLMQGIAEMYRIYNKYRKKRLLKSVMELVLSMSLLYIVRNRRGCLLLKSILIRTLR